MIDLLYCLLKIALSLPSQACQGHVRSGFKVILLRIKSSFRERFCQRSQACLQFEWVSFHDFFDHFVSAELILPLPVRAQCCIKTGQWKDAAKLAEDCLLIDRSNLKVSPSMSEQPRRIKYITGLVPSRFCKASLGFARGG